jgi:hypothetical protein
VGQGPQSTISVAGGRLMSEQAIAPQAIAQAVGPGLGANVLSGSAELLPIAVPGVAETAVWLVRDDRLDHPLQAYVGRWPDGNVRVLSDDQDAWADLIVALGVQIDNPVTALGYLRRFLEVTRGTSVIVREITSQDDLHWRPGSAAEEERRAAFVSGAELEGPVGEVTGTGFHVELTLVVDQRVQRNFFDVTRNGQITASFQVIAEDLPLPIAR